MAKTITHQDDYIDQLNKLIEAYGNETVTRVLDVTLRSIQNYTSDQNPTKPSNTVIRKIHETFAKHEKGEPIELKKPPSTDEGLKDELIAALKLNNTLLKQQVKELEAQQSAPPSKETDIQSHLMKIHQDQKTMFSLLISFQEHWLKLQLANPKKFAEALHSIQKNALEDPEKLLQRGTAFFGGTDDNSKS